jgi:hypothetical protein
MNPLHELASAKRALALAALALEDVDEEDAADREIIGGVLSIVQNALSDIPIDAETITEADPVPSRTPAELALRSVEAASRALVRLSMEDVLDCAERRIVLGAIIILSPIIVDIAQFSPQHQDRFKLTPNVQRIYPSRHEHP